jgi:pyruvate formate lyase activating enzyme
MKTGVVFDIQEFSVHDGPGVRMTVFMKGCPLRCSWCHNPEGINPGPQMLSFPGGQRLSGREYQTGELADIILGQADTLSFSGGGVTFSGGEPLLQADFLLGLMRILRGKTHIILDSSGHGEPDKFLALAGLSDLVFFGLKIFDPEKHRRFTGVDNSLIISNLSELKKTGTPFVARVPLVPGVTDSDENLAGLAGLLRGQGSRMKTRVDFQKVNIQRAYILSF